MEILECDESDEENDDGVPQSSNLLRIPVRILLTLLVWQFCFNVSDVAVGVMVAFLHNFIKLLRAVWNRNNEAATLAQTCPSNCKSTLSSLGLNEDNLLKCIVQNVYL